MVNQQSFIEKLEKTNLVIRMRWKKLGLIFCPNGELWWMQTHASLPTVIRIRKDIYRVYFASRDKDNRSRIGYIDISIKRPNKIINVTKEPALDVGKLGDFDHYGVYPSCAIKYSNKVYLYYIGWDRGYEIWRAFIGLAISEDGGESFKKISNTPIIDRCLVDPYLCTSPYVMIDGDIWRMLYTSGITWEKVNGKPRPKYLIKYAESKDGINWIRKDIICIRFKYNDEWAIARPCVIKEDGIYKMWYCYARGDMGYRIGYAESEDGINWIRKDEEVGIDVSKDGWDSEMICYPYVIVHEGKKYMFYNGNRFGKTGFGLALLKE